MLDQFGLVETTAKAVSTGDRFGRLTVLGVGVIPNTYRYKAICHCDCGSGPKAIRYDHLLRGLTTSCGCYQADVSTKHGKAKHRHYSRWRLMMDRCFNPRCRSYPDYGGRGISVCQEWRDINGYVDGLPSGFFEGAELDRIDNDGDYGPGNVRWVTRAKNATNRRSVRYFTIGGETLMLTDWCVRYEQSVQLVWCRVFELGWSIEDALTMPAVGADDRMARARQARWGCRVAKGRPAPKTDRRLRTVEFKGRQMTMAELATATGISAKLLAKRIFERGWAIERAANEPPN